MDFREVSVSAVAYPDASGIRLACLPVARTPGSCFGCLLASTRVARRVRRSGRQVPELLGADMQ